MTKQEKIQILKHFRENVQRLQEQKAKSDTREQIAQATPIVLKIMSETKTLKKITISPPPMIGGPVVTVNPIENLYHVPYRMEYDVRGVALDMLDATIGVLQLEDDGEPMAKQQSDAWSIMHPEIVKVSKQRFDAGLYADAVEAAFKEINSRVKEMYQQKSGNIKDGSELMFSAFAYAHKELHAIEANAELTAQMEADYKAANGKAPNGKAPNGKTYTTAHAWKFNSLLYGWKKENPYEESMQ